MREQVINHVARAASLAKELRLALQRTRQLKQQLSSTFQSGEYIARFGLQASRKLLNGQIGESLVVDLVLVLGVAREEALQAVSVAFRCGVT